MRYLSKIMFAALTSLVSTAQAAELGMEGATVSVGVHCCTPPSFSTLISNVASAVVGDAIEFPAGTLVATPGNAVIPVNIDVSGFRLTLIFPETATAAPGSFNGYYFQFDDGGTLTSAAVDTGLSSAFPTGLSFGERSILVNIAGMNLGFGETIAINFGVSPVPEPAAAWLLLAGLPLLARRLKTQQPTTR